MDLTAGMPTAPAHSSSLSSQLPNIRSRQTMSTAFLQRPFRAPLQLNPQQPHRGYLSLVKDSAFKQGIDIKFESEKAGPDDQPLWVVTPISEYSRALHISV